MTAACQTSGDEGFLLPDEQFDAEALGLSLEEYFGDSWEQIYGLPREIPEEDEFLRSKKAFYEGLPNIRDMTDTAIRYIATAEDLGMAAANLAFPGVASALGFTDLADLPRKAGS